MDLSGFGRFLLLTGVVIVVVGVVLMLAGRGSLPRVPGDVSFGGRNWRVFLPIGTSILISLVLTVLLNLFLRR